MVDLKGVDLNLLVSLSVLLDEGLGEQWNQKPT